MGTRLNMSDSIEDDLSESGSVDLEELLDRYRDRLTRMVRLRMDQRLQGRIDPSDVIQEATIEASRRMESYLQDRPMTLFLWLRWLVSEQLIMQSRRHLGAEKRDAGREISIDNQGYGDMSSQLLAAQIVGSITGPSAAAIRAERRLRVQQALEQLDHADREIIALRSFEQLTRAETAVVLDIEESAAGKRYVRALKRLKAAVRNISPSSCQDPRRWE
jgi:RNA polymerase sigma-70 factor, ECF subfamily